MLPSRKRNLHLYKYGRSLHFKEKTQKAELNAHEINHSMEIVHIDYLKIESGKSNKDVNSLVVTDHFTRCAQAFINPSQTVKATTQTL